MQKHINMAQMYNILSFIQLPNLENFMQFGKQIIGKTPINLGLHCHKT
jgi:hypothetical protein